MPITPMPAGSTHVKLSATWSDDSGAAIDLTASTITLVLDNGASTRAGAGTVTLTAPASGQFTYAFAAGDVTLGNYTCQFKATYGDSTVLYSDNFPFVVVANA